MMFYQLRKSNKDLKFREGANLSSSKAEGCPVKILQLCDRHLHNLVNHPSELTRDSTMFYVLLDRKSKGKM